MKRDTGKFLSHENMQQESGFIFGNIKHLTHFLGCFSLGKWNNLGQTASKRTGKRGRKCKKTFRWRLFRAAEGRFLLFGDFVRIAGFLRKIYQKSSKIKCPALAVWTQLKPAQNGRWVASAVFLCFQLPTGGREACNSHSESASRLRNVGLKGSDHAPSRALCFLWSRKTHSSSSSSKRVFMNSL